MDLRLVLILSVCVFLFSAGCVNQGANPIAQNFSEAGKTNAGPIKSNGQQPENQLEQPQNITQINQSRPQQIPPFNIPSPDLSTPSKSPLLAGENKTLQLGNVELNYYSVAATYPLYSLGADILITAKNKGSKTESFSLTPISELRAAVPNWNRHFFSFQADNLTLQPGEEKTIHYFASADNEGQFDLTIDLMQGASKKTADVTVYSGSMDGARLDGSAIIYGTVRDEDGNPVQNADLLFYTFSGREQYHAQNTDAFGRYFVAVPGADDIQK
ncbi:MAG: carboxypeptidase-like regulatory domain-containing protein, partial [Candidatus Micrarchaeia archaeon]